MFNSFQGHILLRTAQYDPVFWNTFTIQVTFTSTGATCSVRQQHIVRFTSNAGYIEEMYSSAITTPAAYILQK